LTSVEIHWSTYLPFSIKSYSSISSLSTITTLIDYRTLDNFVDLNKILLLSSYSNTSTSSLEVDKVRRSKVVYSILRYRPFNKSNSLSCFNKVGS